MITVSPQPTARRRPAGAGRSRPEPARVPELAHLTLDGLRAYRGDLMAEETRVSYWRRIMQARLDAAIRDDDHAALRRLGSVHATHQVHSRRIAMHPVQPPDGAPPLPDLAVLWDSPVEGADEQMIARLTRAEQELSSYRRSLHQRIDTATAELIARYREDPSLALSALPLRPTDRPVVA